MRLVIALTGCSGIIYGVRLLEVLKEAGIETDLIVSPSAEKVLEIELGKKIKDVESLSTKIHGHCDLAASISSGSVKTDGMIIAPCSMKTLGSIASGVTSDLISRAADVTLKQERPLVLVPRETPLNLIHIENMAKVKRAGATILPAMPGFYHGPKDVSQLVDFVVGKILDALDIDHELYKRWGT